MYPVLYIFISLNLLIFPLEGAINWPQILKEFTGNPERYEHSRVEGGASNLNYRLRVEGQDYFVRTAPKSTALLGADIAVEYQVLTALEKFEISPKPLYFDAEQRMLVMEFLEKDLDEVDLLDEETQKEALLLVRQLEGIKVDLERHYNPSQEIADKILLLRQLGVTSLDPFIKEVKPFLDSVEGRLLETEKSNLIHLDLHHKNFIHSKGRLWLIDWEYATLGDGLFTIASMASIERWNDELMRTALEKYTFHCSEELFQQLRLYRILIDIHWALWNGIQNKLSTIQAPYEEWQKLFQEAAIERIQSLRD